MAKKKIAMETEAPTFASDPLYQRVNELKVDEETRQFLSELVALTHNNALRAFETGIIMDGLITLLTQHLQVPFPVIQNYTALARAVKEYYMFTKQMLKVDEAIALFVGADYVIGSNPQLKINVEKFLAEREEGDISHDEDNEEDNQKIHH